MDSEDKFWAWITGIICAAGVVLALGLFALNNMRTKMFVENEYTRKSLKGYSYPQWVKEVQPENK